MYKRIISALLILLFFSSCGDDKNVNVQNKEKIKHEEKVNYLMPVTRGNQVVLVINDVKRTLIDAKNISHLSKLIQLRDQKKITDLIIKDGSSIESFNGIGNYSSLRYLYIKNSSVSELGELASLSNSLQYLIIDGSNLKSLDKIVDFNKLRVLSITRSPIVEIPNLSYLPLESVSFSNTKIRVASLHVPKGLSSIYLDNVGVESLSDVQDLFLFTEKLSLSFNNVENIDERDYGTVKWMCLYSNPVAGNYTNENSSTGQKSVKIGNTWFLFSKPDDTW